MHSSQRSKIGGAIILMLALAACAMDKPSATANNTTSAACPPLRGYSEEFRKRAVAEMDLLPTHSAVEEMLADYAVLRQQIRACQP
jgi:hypothetical protein